MIPVSDYAIADTMLRHGGSFVRKLAEAWLAGDPENRVRVQQAFPDLWEKYAVRAQQERQTEAPR